HSALLSAKRVRRTRAYILNRLRFLSAARGERIPHRVKTAIRAHDMRDTVRADIARRAVADAIHSRKTRAAVRAFAVRIVAETKIRAPVAFDFDDKFVRVRCAV